MTAIDPTEQQLAQLTSGNKEGPFHFVNLLRFKDVADYPSDHEMAGKKISGEEAYDIYGAVAFKHVTQRGGRLRQARRRRMCQRFVMITFFAAVASQR
jgi:hypothetical protein